MIDIENEVFQAVAETLKALFPKVTITGDYIKSPSSFPCVSLMETDNQVRESTSDSGTLENHVNVLYEVNVYSNKTSGKKSECKAIMAAVDIVMCKLGFIRVLLNPIPNEQDATVFRMVARYRAAVGKDKMIYRR